MEKKIKKENQDASPNTTVTGGTSDTTNENTVGKRIIRGLPVLGRKFVDFAIRFSEQANNNSNKPLKKSQKKRTRKMPPKHKEIKETIQKKKESSNIDVKIYIGGDSIKEQ